MLAPMTYVPRSVSALPEEPNECNDSSFNMHFTNDPLWTETKKFSVLEGIVQLNYETDHADQPLVDIEVGDAAGGNEIQIKDRTPSSGYGSSECQFGATIWVNSNFNEREFYWKVGRHEAFHLAGAEHGGRYDSWDGLAPTTMTTKLNFRNDANEMQFRPDVNLIRDDRAHLNWLHNNLPYRQIVANFGFNDGGRHYNVLNGAGTVRVFNNGGANSPRHLGIMMNAPSGVLPGLMQTTRLWTGDGDESYRLRGNFRGSEPGSQTDLLFFGTYRMVSDGPDPDPDNDSDDYEDGIQNPNQPSIVGGWVYPQSWRASAHSNDSIWRTLSTPFFNPPSSDALDIQLRVQTFSQGSGGAMQNARLDDLRVEGT